MILITLVLFFITLEVLIAIDYVSQEKELRMKRANVYELIIKLQNQIGYGGLIHNFKNFVLRPDNTNYREEALKNHQRAVLEVERLEQVGDSVLINFKMTATRAMLTAYKERLDTLPDLIASKTSAREVDMFVRYNDIPSRVEINAIPEKVNKELDSQFSTIRYNSFISAFMTLIGLITTLTILVHLYFKGQRKALKASNALNNDLKVSNIEIERSQAILLSVIKDVDSEKKDASRLNEQLSRKNKEMEQFIYTVSHDLKSPLVTIGGFANKLITELSEVMTEKQLYRLNRIIENVNNMESLLTDLLNLSKIVQQPITFSATNLYQVIDNQKLALESLIVESGAKINVADDVSSINANERLLSEAILNLLSNAIRYREPSRPLIIEIYTTQGETSTTVHIKDNGIGIDNKYHELVFGIFERLSSIAGTGVGLTIVRTIMEKHRGKVSLTSKLGEGCCFSLEFPNRSKS